MKLSISLLVAALATAVAGNEYICETTDGSPYLHHVDTMIAYLRDRNEELCRKMDNGECSETIRTGDSGAGVQICGWAFHCHNAFESYCHPGCGISTVTMADELQILKDTCVQEGDQRVGGKVKGWDEDGEIRLYTLPGR